MMGLRRMVETFYKIKNCPCLVALISDTHNRNTHHVLSSLRNNHPDLICVPGDFVHGAVPKHGLKIKESSNAIDLLVGCVAIAPTYVSLGNHERILSSLDIDLIKETGVVLLDNDWASWNGIVIGGLSPARVMEYRIYRSSINTKEIYPRPPKHHAMSETPPKPALAWLNEYCSEPGYHILLCHHPEYYTTYLLNRQIELILSGHAHGGQCRYYSPIKKEWRGIYAPGQGFMPQYTSGVVDGRLVISRGLSNTLIVPRLFNPPEMVYICK